jgi:hypothetical protein
MSQEGRLLEGQPQGTTEELLHGPLTLTDKTQTTGIKAPIRGKLGVSINWKQALVIFELPWLLKIGVLQVRAFGNERLKLEQTCT